MRVDPVVSPPVCLCSAGILREALPVGRVHAFAYTTYLVQSTPSTYPYPYNRTDLHA